VDLPNTITSARVGLALLGSSALLFLPPELSFTLALGVFLVAAVTDWLDGHLARRKGRFSALGTFLDPLADKVLVYGYFAFFTWLHSYPAWIFIAMLTRDLVYDGYRSFAASQGLSVPAHPLSKWKTALQMFSLALILVAHLSGLTIGWQVMLPSFAVFIMVIALVFGVGGAAASILDRHVRHRS
jgi:CDP-diacylglycerol--glycerol-3-phosphate 3-phosphatidyltransferase